MVETLQTNTFGPIALTQALPAPAPKVGRGARDQRSPAGTAQLDGLSAGVPSYCLSKTGPSMASTIMLAQALRSDRISVNSVCPGWVRTDMGGANADRSVEEGAGHDRLAGLRKPRPL